MKVITVGTLKGGTGKTTVVFNLAGVLSEKNKILIIDADAQCNISSDVGINIADQSKKTIKDIFENSKIKPEEVIEKSPIKELPNLDIIGSSIKLTATELQLVSRAGREQILKYYIDDNIDIFNKYDYIIIDTNPSMGIVNQNAFYVADDIILVSDVSYNGIQGAELFMYLWEEARNDLRKKDNISALIINNYDKRIGLSSDLKQYCSDTDIFKNILIDTPIPGSIKLKETSLNHKPVNITAGKHQACIAIREVAKELKKKGIL